jgi:glycosyltransferase involved in cell wall biosynthesis
VSVVTPSFNAAPFIRQTLDSVAEQDYPRIEHIVVDGGSTDGTAALLAQADGIRWISEPDGGQADAIAKGFAMAQGEIVAWLNADDVYLPGAVSAAVAELQQRPDCGLVFAGCVVIDADGQEVDRSMPPDFSLPREIDAGNSIPQPTVFLRRAALDAVGGVDTAYHYAMDYDLWLRVGTAFPVVRAEGYWAGFRMHPASKSVAHARRFWREEREISRKHGGVFFSELLIARLVRLARLPYAAVPVFVHAASLLRERRILLLIRKAIGRGVASGGRR